MSFVEYNGAYGVMEERFVDLRNLTTLEQNAQLFWFKIIWELYRVICKYQLTTLKEEWNKKMAVAKKRWEEKFRNETDYDSEVDDSLCIRLWKGLVGSKRKANGIDINPRV